MSILWYNFLLLVVIALFSFYKWATHSLNYWKKRNFPYVKPLPLIGNYLDVLLGKANLADQYVDFCNQMKNVKYFGILVGTYPCLLVKDPQLVMKILVKDFRHFYDRGFHVGDGDFLGNSLFFMRNPKWKAIRTKIVSVFSSSKLKATFDIIDKCSNDLIDYLNENQAAEEVVSTRRIMEDVITDIVCKAICGIEIHSIKSPNKKHVEMQTLIFAPGLRSHIRNLANFFIPNVAKMINVFAPVLDSYFTDLTFKSIELRKQQDIKRPDLLQLMMEIYEKEQLLPADQRVIREQEIVSGIFLFIAAGYETSSSTSTCCLHELAYHPDIQNKLRHEIREVFEQCDHKLKYDDLNKLTYLDQVISETLRLYPLVNTIFRECMEEYIIPGTGHKIEKNVFVHIPSLALHTDPNYWSHPQEFDPSRFSKENIDSVVPGSYIPFGDGPRICIGKRFAILQLKLVLSKILYHYEVSPSEKTSRHYPLTKNSLLSVPEGVFWLNFKRLKH